MTTRVDDSTVYPNDWSESYRQFFTYASDLVAPLLALIEPGLPGVPIVGPASDHDAKADNLESFVRPLLMVVQWLPLAERCDDPWIQAQVQKARQWIVESVELGTTKAHAHYWATSRNVHQNQVEMGLFTVALRMNDGYAYHLLPDDVKASLCEWLATGRRCGMYRNNHIFFGVFIIEFLGWAGHAELGDDALVDFYFGQLESMYLDQGWFIDGMNETVDYYNAFAFHYYGFWWSILYGEKNAARKARWSEWGGEFLKSYSHLISADGDYPLFGRSMTYRFNVLAPIGLAEVLGVNPLSSGAARRLCRLDLEYFLKRPIYQEQNCLSVGYVDTNEEMAESYSCGASPYWAAKGFSFLSLPPQHPFWHDEEESIPAEQGDSVISVNRAGLLIRNFDGRSELFNAGVAVAMCNTRFGPFKWSKLAYRSGVGTLLPRADKIPLDLSLVATATYGTVYGRHKTTPLELSEDCAISSYSLGTKDDELHVCLRSMVFWKKGWLLMVHVGESYQACQLSQGSFALASSALVDSQTVGGDFAVIESESTVATLQNLSGYEDVAHVCSRADQAREHSHGRYHQFLRADRKLTGAGPFCLAAICGESDQTSMRLPWAVSHSVDSELKLQHPEVGEWCIQHPMMPAMS